MAAQQLSDCNASNDSDGDLVLELQLDGTRDIKPRDTTNKPAVSTSNDTSTSTMANGHDNDIPLHDKIARKIKAESLARSIPSHEGPFKCPKCKRLYRTKESCGKHALLCDFEVSTSEEEEDEEEEEELSSIEALSARTQAPCETGTQRCDIIGVNESESVDSTESSDVISESEPFIGDSEVTPARSRSAADPVTGSCKSYPLRSSRMSSPETTPRDSEISTPASSVRHRQGQSSKDADDINNGDGAGSGDGESVRTLRSGRRTLTPNDVAPKQCETVTRAISVSQTPSQCDTITKDSVSQTPQIKPKRGRGRPPKIRGPGRPPKARVENTTEAMSGVNTGSRVKSQVECTPTQLGENKGKEKVDRVKVASEGCDMARMLSCRVDVCQLSIKPPMIDTCKDDVKKCLAVSVRERCQLLSDDTPKLVTNMNSAVHAGMPLVVATSENTPGETQMDISAEFPSASLVSMTTASGVNQCNADTKCTSPAPDMHASSDSASSPVDIPTGSQQQQQQPLQQQQQQQQQHGDRVQDKDVETIDSKLSGQLIDITMSSDNVDMTSPAECLMGKDSDTIAETSVKVSSMQGDVSIVDASLSSVDVSPLCQLPVSDPSYTSVALDDSRYANIPVTVLEMCHSDSSADACDARVPPSDVKESASELPCTKVSVSDLCHTKMATSDACGSRVPVGDTVMSTNQSYLAKVTNPCDAGGGLGQTEIPLSDACRTTEASQSLQMLHKGQSPKSMSKVGLLQPVQCHKPILPSSLRHLEVSGQINYLGSFSIDPNSPQVMLRGTTLPCGPHPLIMEHATAAVQGSGTSSNPTQIASMCSTSGAVTLGTTWNTDVVGQGEYIPGLQDRTMMCVSNLPRHAVSVRQEELASGAMPDASLTSSSDCLASVGTTHDGRMTVICSASTVCGTLKSFVQSNVCHSLAATRDMPPLTVTNAGRTIQSIEMSSLGVPSVHYQQGMLISHCQPPSQLPSHLPTQVLSQVSSQPFSQMTSAPLRPLMAKHKTSNSVVKKRPIQGPVDHIGLYKKAKLHPMAPPVLQSKQDNMGGRSKLGWSHVEAQKWKYQRRNCGTNKLKTVGRLKTAPGQRRHKPVLGSAVSKSNQGHIMSEGSHPLIHASYQQSSLPEAEVEEEVVESKAVLTSDGYEMNEPLQRDRAKRDSPYLMFEITSDDGFSVQTETCEDAWRAVTERVQDARANARMKQLSYSGVSGLQMFGLTHAVIVQLLEQLQGAKYCRNYHFEYFTHDHRDTDEEPEENPSGVARAEPFIGRKANEMFSFLLSQYRIKPEFDASLATKEEEMVHKSQRRATSMDLPMAMRFRHLRQNAKQACDVYRSDIHGRGLFCKRDIDAGEMIIEYAGEVIRSAMTDRREHYYESKGIGCYMFRIDDMEVVDATMKGSAARFINHSCDPSCYSKVINVDGKKHIIIFAMRPIKRGEELTYDYKFPIEDVKIPCTCGTKRCRRYLN